MNKQFKKIIGAFTIVLILGFGLYLIDGGGKAQIAADILVLNNKYGAVEIEAFEPEKKNEKFDSLKANLFKASVFDDDVPETELIIELADEDDLKANAIASAEEKFNNVAVVKLRTHDDIETVAEEYSKSPNIKYAEPNYKIKLDLTRLESLKKTREEKNASKEVELKDESESKVASKKTEIKKDIIVAVIDSGVDKDHPDLRGRVLRGKSFFQGSKELTDINGHGTHVSGIIIRNSKSAKIMPLKFTSGNEGRLSDVAKAIKYATDQKASVINLSLGLYEKTQTMAKAIKYADSKGVIVVAAAGNDNKERCDYPALYSEVISVAALDWDEESKLKESNYGSCVDFSAVGRVESTLPNKRMGVLRGTSQAAPMVSAKIADIISEKGSLKLKDIKSELDSVSKDLKGEYSDKLGGKIE